MTQVIADTSALYALVDRTDPHHLQAANFLKSRASHQALLMSNHVFDETMTVVKARLGMRVALQLGLRLRNSRFVEMVVFSPAEEQETWRVFSQYTDKDWSYTDCACLVLARGHELNQAFTFDHHFAQMGLVMVP
jgi:predicted nucleic acid-binding protein